MYRLLIVDDESWIRERLKHTIDWDTMGITVVGEACDGEEALEKTESLKPDIVLTDIRMPCIDGLEFIKSLRDGHNDVKVVIISGYSDFDYAQKAIKLGAFDYILKPVEDENLTDVIKRCIKNIDEEISRKLLFEKAGEQVKESLPVLKKEFYLNLINGNFKAEEEIHKELAYLEIEHRQRNMICFIIEVDSDLSENGDTDWDGHLVRFVLKNIAQDFLNKLGKNECFLLPTGEVICLIFTDKEDTVLMRQVLSISGGIRKMFKRITGYSVTIGIGRTCSSLSGISYSFKEAGEALQNKFYLGRNRIYDIRCNETLRRPQSYKLNDMEALLNNIKMGNKEIALSTLEMMINKAYRKDADICPVDLKLLFMDVINSVFRAVSESVSSFDEFSIISINFFEQLKRLQTIEEIHQWLMEAIVKIIDMLSKYRVNKKRKVIEKAVEYINEHYTEAITLNSIAEKFFMNASYFCKVFKEEMGEPFTKYFINLRLQKAKQLMSDPTLKIYEIAGMVGYEDVQYFTKIFKSIQGVTPTQYREKIK